MAFEGLTEKLNATFKKLRGKGRLTENDVREAMREVRLALLSGLWGPTCWTASRPPSRSSRSSTKS